MSDQKKKKMIITGGELGIGRGIVHYFAEKGYDIVFSYHSKPEEAEKLTAMYNSRYNSKVQGIYTDFSEPEGAHDFFCKAIELLDGVDVLVNNAGQSIPQPLYALDEDSIDYIMRLDFRTYLILMRDVAKYMKENNIHGNIINISSSRGERAYPNAGVYEWIKGGLNQAIQCFALDMAPYGIRVNNVAPGAIRIRSKEELFNMNNPLPTDYYWKPEYKDKTKPVISDMWDELGPCIPLRRSGLPEDIAKTINFLISDDADYITGVTIRVDGGLILAGMPEDGKSKWN